MRKILGLCHISYQDISYEASKLPQWGSSVSSNRMYFLLLDDLVNPIALRKAKIVYNFGLSECNRVKTHTHLYLDFSKTELKFIKESELQIRGSIEDNSKIIFFISQ